MNKDEQKKNNGDNDVYSDINGSNDEINIRQNEQKGTHTTFESNGKLDFSFQRQNKINMKITKERSKSSAKFKALVEANTKVAPKWLETNLEEMSAKVVALPAREDIDLEIAEHLIIELYSK